MFHLINTITAQIRNISESKTTITVKIAKETLLQGTARILRSHRAVGVSLVLLAAGLMF